MSDDGATKVAVVTGASRGIGRDVATGLAKAGYAVVLIGRRKEDLERLAEDLAPARSLAIVADVGDPDQVRTAFAAVDRTFGRVDVLFNNAGIGAPAVAFEDLGDADWLGVIGANLNGSFFCAREAVRLMKRQTPRGGRIINNGSVSAHRPRPYSAAYTASKHAITGLTKSIALDGRDFDIACSQIDIGNAATDLTAAMTAGVPQADGSMRPEPVMPTKHVVDAVLFMAGLPLQANVNSMTIMATKMPFVGRG